MKQFLSALRRKLRGQLIPVLAVLVAIGLPTAIMAWGPNRDTFTVANPANRVVFNSITDNPHVGDERNFVVIKDAANTNDGGWQDDITVQPGKEYLVRMYVHNNANANLNLKAVNTRVKASVPTTTAKSIPISGFVSADNASPKEVWDDIRLNSDKDFNLIYVEGSARNYNNITGSNGAQLSDKIVTSEGAQVGYNEPGVVPGCFEFVNYVYFKVKPQFANTTKIEMSKTVRKLSDSDKTWKESVAAKPGDKVEYRIKYTNKGQQQQDNVVVKDTLPQGVSYVNGSTKLYTTLNPNGNTISDNVTRSGVNIGNYQSNSTAYVIFTAQVASNDQLPKCGPNTLRNIAKVETDYGQKEDDANVIVPKECQPEVKYSCDALKVDRIERTKFKFTTTTSQENATFKKVTYVIKNEQGTEVDRKESTAKTLEYTRTEAGKYTVEAIVTFTVNGQDKTVPVGNCKDSFEVVKEKTPGIKIDKKVDGVEHKKVGVNQEFTYQIVVTNTGEVDLKDAVVTDKAPNGVMFTKASAGTISNNQWSYTIGELKVGQATSFTITAKVPAYLAGKIVNTVCIDSPQIPGNPDDCDDASVEVPPAPEKPCVPGKDAECTETPEVPTELPKTGAGDNTLALIGAGALIASLGYYFASRRAIGA